MLKRVIEINGKFYIKKGIFIQSWWSVEDNYWWHIHTRYRTAFNSKEEAIKAYKNRKAKFRGFVC
jgi:hypothetical protein